MNLDSSNLPVFLPQAEQETVLRLGFQNCTLQEWLFAADDLRVFHANKTALIHDRGRHCHAETASSAAAQGELYDRLLQHLLQQQSLGYRRSDNRLIQQQQGISWEIGERKLWPASLWVAEDICLLEEIDSHYVLSAASVCAPSNWHLEEKIGQSIDFIHAPVPGYQKGLDDRVNRFLRGLASDRVMLRYNWSIQAGNALYWRDGDSGQNAVSPLYWRVERQTFLRLPLTGAIVFAIRIFLHSFASLKSVPGFEQSIERLCRQLPAAEKHYKGIDQLHSWKMPDP